jgi:hypothetical protein
MIFYFLVGKQQIQMRPARAAGVHTPFYRFAWAFRWSADHLGADDAGDA